MFVVGSPRSGTTWVQRLLVAHDQIAGGPESHFFNAFGPVMGYVRPRPEEKRVVGLSCYFTERRFHEILREIWYEAMTPVLAAKPAARVLVEKTPDHAHHLKRVVALFPESKIIHVIRDSRAVVASMLAASKQAWGRDWAPSDAASAAMKWVRCVQDAQAIGRALPPQRYMEVFYEDLLADPILHTARMFEFAGVAHSGQLVESIVAEQSFENQRAIGGTPLFVTGEGARQQRSAFEPRGFFHRGTADGWKDDLSFWQRRKVWKITGWLMRELGYAREGRRAG